MEGQLPSESLPFVEGDFNACGWAGDGDMSIYALDRATLQRILAEDGMLAFVWTDDDPGEILGQVATLEYITLGAFTGWRANPVPGTFYRGPKPAELLGDAAA